MEQIFGKGVSKGVAAGPISFYRRASGVIPRHEVSDTAAELERFRAARETAKEQLAKLYDKALAEAGEDAAMLFEAHQMMLDDLDFVESIEGMIENDRVNAEAAVSDTGAQFAEMFAAMDDSYMQARAADIRDISARVIGILTGEGESGIVSDVPCIVAADDLAPSETVQLDKALILGTHIRRFWPARWAFRPLSAQEMRCSRKWRASTPSLTARPARRLSSRMMPSASVCSKSRPRRRR